MTEQTQVSVSGLRQLQQALAAAGHRRVILVEGDREAARARIFSLLRQWSPAEGAWVGSEDDAARAGLPHLAMAQYRRALGQEFSILVWDGWAGHSPDAFAALAGALRAGGLLFWLTPELNQWRYFPDPDYARTGLDRADEHPFANRLANMVGFDEAVLRLRPEDEGVTMPDCSEARKAGFRPGPTGEQQAVIEEIVRQGLGRRRRPLVITADRGRGKSAALGLAAARLLLAGRERVLVTAPSADNTSTLFRHAAAALGNLLSEETATGLTTTAGRELCFLTPQDLLSQQPAAEVVMVDEAAGLSVQWLKAILLGWPRVVFASTVHGYEGTGRGFTIRFRQVLDEETPQWRAVSLSRPIRWAVDDPLERLVSRMYLLAAEAPEPGMAGDVCIERWEPAEAEESVLSEAFGLLVNAHYRTTPADLRQWLDDPAAMTWRASIGGRTVGVLWAVLEGGLPEGLANDVAAGKRRLRGQLLAQSLANHGGFPEAARLRTLRVVRVAVTESARRQGIGQRLVQAATAACQEARIDLLGTSFGGESGLLAFWARCGLTVVRMGLRQEVSTGEFPLQMLQGITNPGQALEERLRQRFASHWPLLISRHWDELDHDLLLAVGSSLPAAVTLGSDDQRDLANFAHGFRGYELTLPVLLTLSACEGVLSMIRKHPEARLWCRAVLQGWSWDRLRNAGECRGQRDGEQRLRALVSELLQRRVEL